MSDPKNTKGDMINTQLAAVDLDGNLLDNEGHLPTHGNQDHLMHRITEQAFGRDSLQPDGNDVEHSINLNRRAKLDGGNCSGLLALFLAT